LTRSFRFDTANKVIGIATITYFIFSTIAHVTCLSLSPHAVAMMHSIGDQGTSENLLHQFDALPGIGQALEPAEKAGRTTDEINRRIQRFELLYFIVAVAFVLIFSTAAAVIFKRHSNQDFIDLYRGENRPRLKSRKVITASIFFFVFGCLLLTLVIYGVGLNADTPGYRDAFDVWLAGAMMSYLFSFALLVYVVNRRPEAPAEVAPS
jgi:hypothetical protein